MPKPPDDLLEKNAPRIAGMFNAIAGRYDTLNRLLSAGLDRRWRRRAVDALALRGDEILLDVCTGTADVAIEAVSRRERGARRAIGFDFAIAMLRVGSTKLASSGLADRVPLLQADATRIPLRAESVDAVTIAFGIRNVQDPDLACREIRRVLRSGGRLAILEFGVPVIPGIGAAYLWYFKYVLPRIGRVVSRHNEAYSYLPASVSVFPAPATFMRTLEAAGLSDARAVPLTFGVVYLYTAIRR